MVNLHTKYDRSTDIQRQEMTYTQSQSQTARKQYTCDIVVDQISGPTKQRHASTTVANSRHNTYKENHNTYIHWSLICASPMSIYLFHLIIIFVRLY